MSPDENLLLILNRALSGPASTALFRAVTWLGNGVVLALLVLVPLWVLDRVRFRNHVVALASLVACRASPWACTTLVDGVRVTDPFR